MHDLRSVPATSGRSVVVGIPAYNEDRFIGSLVLKLRARDRPIVVVDDGSSDATAELAEAAGASVVRHGVNRGKTAAVATLFQRALAMDADVLVVLDGDSQHDPAEVDQLAGPILKGEADMVVGSRFAGVRSVIPRWRVAGGPACPDAGLEHRLRPAPERHGEWLPRVFSTGPPGNALHGSGLCARASDAVPGKTARLEGSRSSD